MCFKHATTPIISEIGEIGTFSSLVYLRCLSDLLRCNWTFAWRQLLSYPPGGATVGFNPSNWIIGVPSRSGSLFWSCCLINTVDVGGRGSGGPCNCLKTTNTTSPVLLCIYHTKWIGANQVSCNN